MVTRSPKNGVLFKAIMIVLLVTLSAGVAAAQTSLRIIGAPAVHLNPSWAGGYSNSARDTDGSTEIHWDHADKNAKITVSTFCPGQRFSLTVEAKNPRNAKATGVVQLIDGMRDTDLLVHIKKKKAGSAQIVYITEVLFEQGHTENGQSDIHAVTYTISEQ